MVGWAFAHYGETPDTDKITTCGPPRQPSTAGRRFRRFDEMTAPGRDTPPPLAAAPVSPGPRST
jgi:hypothetical protein